MEKRIEYNKLNTYVKNLLMTSGIEERDALIVSDVLIRAELQGVSSHGLSRLEVYLHRISKGLINKKPNFSIDFKFPALGIMDADNSLGHLAAHKAMTAAVEKAKSFGISMVGVKNSNHFGTASYYAEMAVKENLVGFVISNGPPATPPWGGKEMYFGTNPLAVGIPGGERGPIVVDMATSIVARGKIIKAAKEGKEIEPGWALDEEGNPTTNPGKALKGCILPMGGHKGSAITMLIELMAGLLTGAGYGKQVAWQYDENSGKGNVGHIFCAMNPEGFMEADEIRSKMDNFYDEIKGIPKAQGFDSIRLPGESRSKNMDDNIKEGIKLNDTLYKDLVELGNNLGVEMPEIL
ncbi:MAG: Ldh family oxidoreductase [Desulfitobacteriaceae bacterium]|nr:Ldh family oxidoreductase [Desulfitobacteriaceae bacterium]